MERLSDPILISEKEGFEVYFTPLCEYAELRELLPYDSEEEIYEMLTKMNSGDLVYFCAKVSVNKKGVELSENYLGGCIYSSFEDFINEKNGYIGDMIKESLSEAKEKIKELIN